MDKQFAVYIMASRKHGTLYIGVTSELKTRVYQHKQKMVEGFTKRHNIFMLVYYEIHANAESAIAREKKLKRHSRVEKIKLITSLNLEWEDLYEKI